MSASQAGATQRNARRIGAFVLGALILAVIAVTAIGGFRVFRTKQLAVIYFDRSINGLAVGSPVKFKGIEIGRVERISLDFPDPSGDISNFRIPVIIDIQADLLADRGVRVDLRDPTVHQRLVEHGLRAHLAAVSYITGALYVSLDFDAGPEPPRFHNDAAFSYPEIPTRPTPLDEVQADLSRIVERLSTADLPLLIDSLTTMAGALSRAAASINTGEVLKPVNRTLTAVERTLAEVTSLLDSIGGRMSPAAAQLDSTARAVRHTLATAEAMLGEFRVAADPGGPLLVRAEEAMHEFARAARGFRELVEAIERNPSILLRGRDGGPPR